VAVQSTEAEEEKLEAEAEAEAAEAEAAEAEKAEATWCVTQRGRNWFNSRGYPGTEGRGFVIYPQGKDVVDDSCYVFYLNQNNTATPAVVLPSIVAHNFTDC
jgi:MSHA pilin protein MshA